MSDDDFVFRDPFGMAHYERPPLSLMFYERRSITAFSGVCIWILSPGQDICSAAERYCRAPVHPGTCELRVGSRLWGFPSASIRENGCVQLQQSWLVVTEELLDHLNHFPDPDKEPERYTMAMNAIECID